MSVAEIRESVRSGGLLADGEPLIVLLSGGRDSVCLLDVCATLCGAGSVSALHVNYGLRASAERDERHCAALCRRLGVELLVVRAGRPPGEPAEPTTGNLQAWAREFRYEQARLLAEPRGAAIAAGHTASDQVETILYRLAASPGRRALLGMAAAEGGLIRPLLGLTREQTAAYCRARGLGWCEDESNEDRRFARVRVRHDVLPALRTAQLLREETELLDGLIDAELSDGPRIAVERLGELPAALARMVVVRLAEQASGAYVPQAGERVEELLALGARGGRAELHLGGGAGAVIEGGVLRMRLLAADESSGRGRNQPPPTRHEPPDGRPRRAPPGED